MTDSIDKLRIVSRKQVIVKNIEKLEQWIHEEDTPSLAKKAFEINLTHLRDEYRKLEILERSLQSEEA